MHRERDDVQYQCVPQPGNPVGNPRTAAEYGYASGTTFGSPGHVRVRVGPDEVVVEFVRSAVAGMKVERGGRDIAKEDNGAIVDRYSIAARKASTQDR
ncbi:MAG: hypothetical protein SFY96_02860 [Planctomycetota bacterium]|nr:hypothetical protein [Planctomycetota bacterium]